MPNGRYTPTEALVEPREIVVRIRVVGIGRDHSLIGGDGLLRTVEIAEHDPQVECRGEVLRAGGESASIVCLRSLELARFMQQPAEIRVRVGMLGGELD